MPRWELSYNQAETLYICQGSGEEAALCLLAFGVVIPAGSFIISGSVVLIGNTAHWLEYQGRCEQGIVQRSASLFTGTAPLQQRSEPPRLPAAEKPQPKEESK